MALILREMATSFGRSPGGYFWAVAEPVAGIALLTMIFSLGFHAPPIGPSFTLFYASGLLPFLVYVDVSTKTSQAIVFSTPLLRYPRVTLMDAILARAILNCVTQTVVICLVLTPLLWLIDTRGIVDFRWIFFASASAMALGFGVGIVNCFLVTRFAVWQRVWGIVNRPMFILSCVIFTYETVPRPFQSWLWYNPVTHIVGAMRRGLFYGYEAAYVSLAYCWFVSAILACAGFGLVWLFKNRLLNP